MLLFFFSYRLFTRDALLTLATLRPALRRRHRYQTDHHFCTPPKNNIFEEIIRKFNKPVAAPSANISGNVSPTKAMHVYEEFGKKIELIIDGGASEKGIESTVIDARGDNPIILRHGPITSEMIENKTNLKVLSNFKIDHIILFVSPK